MSPSNKRLAWFLTYQQCGNLTHGDILDHLQSIDTIREYVIAMEKHADGNNHIHAYVKFMNGVKLNDGPNTFGLEDGDRHQTCDCSPVRSPVLVIKYCTKKSDYISNFDVEAYIKKQGKKKPLSVATIKSKTAKQALEDGDISIMHIKNYQTAKALLTTPYAASDVRGIWIDGPPGTGKSHHARQFAEQFEGLYIKQQNKWWDGYAGEHAVLLDDLDTPVLGHHLKIWADKYAANGEIKGAQCALEHRVLIVTSNYSIDSLFTDDDPNKPQKGRNDLIAALKRRFIQITLMERVDVVPELVEALDMFRNTQDVPGTSSNPSSDTDSVGPSDESSFSGSSLSS